MQSLETMQAVMQVIIAIGVVITALAGFGAWHYSEKIADLEKQALNEKVDAVLTGLGGNSDLAIELLDSRMEKAFGSNSETDAKDFVINLMQELPERQTQLEELHQSNPEIINHLRLKWEPIVLPMIEAYNSRIRELKEQGIVVGTEVKLDTNVLITDISTGVATSSQALSPVDNSFSGGSASANLQLAIGEVVAGEIEMEPTFQLSYTIRNRHNASFWIRITKENTLEGYAGIEDKGDQAIHQIPVELPTTAEEQQKLIDTFIVALNQVITKVTVNAER